MPTSIRFPEEIERRLDALARLGLEPCGQGYRLVLPVNIIWRGYMMGSKAVKLDDRTYKRLQALGEARKRAPHSLMKEAIHQFLDREEEAERIRQDTLKRWERYEVTGETISHDVVDAWLETWGTEGEGKCPVP